MKRRDSTKGEGVSSPPSPPLHKNVLTRGGAIRPHHAFHVDNRASLLSTEAPAQNYRGLVNLVMLVLVFHSLKKYNKQHTYRISFKFVTHFRLIMENMLKYGILVNLTSTYIEWGVTIPMILSKYILPLFFFSFYLYN